MAKGYGFLVHWGNMRLKDVSNGIYRGYWIAPVEVPGSFEMPV